MLSHVINFLLLLIPEQIIKLHKVQRRIHIIINFMYSSYCVEEYLPISR